MTTTEPKATTPSPTAAGPRHSRPTAGASPEREPSDGAGGGNDSSGSGGGRSVSVWSVLALIAGCAILVVAAINLPNLGRWGDEHGNVLVFLCFFLVMSIGGRWFWAGVDALWGAIRGKGN
ncbi:hypothetical protein [Gordonia sp. MMO-8]|uniref:hypothetical protein n=1 Tax=Gordonia sp. MMO-8 TaxID=3127886 RepID=UPI00301B4546